MMMKLGLGLNDACIHQNWWIFDDDDDDDNDDNDNDDHLKVDPTFAMESSPCVTTNHPIPEFSRL